MPDSFKQIKIPNDIPCSTAHFVGREPLIQELMAAATNTRMIAVLGISGIGKTALMAQIASRFEPSRVFWHEFRAGLASVDDVLMRLACFLDPQIETEVNLGSVIQAHTLSKNFKIELIIEKLNQACFYLFFDSVHYLDKDLELNSFFSLLKQRLQRGTILVAGRSQPSFYTGVDEAKNIVKSVRLDGLSKYDIQIFFKQRTISLKPKAAKTLAKRFHGLPLALELIATLLSEGFPKQNLVLLADKAEEKVIDLLFETVYQQLNSNARNLLTIASFFIIPFSLDTLVGAYNSILGKNNTQCKILFKKLQQQFLIQDCSSNFYKVHEVIRTLTLSYVDEPSIYQVKLANYLISHAQNDGLIRFEVVLLYYEAKEFNRAAEVVVDVIDGGLLPYYPDWAEGLLNKFEEKMINPEQWVWLLGCKGNLASFWRRYEEAKDCYEAMLKVASKLQDKKAAAIAFQRLGIVYHARNNDLAEKNYFNSLSLKKELNDLEGQAQLYNQLGLLYIDRHKFEEAHSKLAKGFNLLENIGASDWQKLPLYENLGILYGEQKNFKEAIRFTKSACRIAEEMGMHYEIAIANYNLGKLEAEQANQELAQKYYLNTLKIAKKYNLWEPEELAQIALGKQYYKFGDYDNGVSCFQRALKIQNKVKDRTKLVFLYFDIGSFYYLKMDTQTALSYYHKGIGLFEHLNDEKQVQLYLNNIYLLANQSLAPRQILQALKFLKNRLLVNSPSYALAKVYGTLGKIYLNILHLDKVALACLQQEINLLAQLLRSYEQVEALAHLGTIYEDMGSYRQALEKNTQAINISKVNQLYTLAAGVYYNRANCFTKLEMWQQAENDYQRSLVLAEEVQDTNIYELALHNLGEMYRRWERPVDALNYLKSSLDFSAQRNNIDGQVIALNNLGLVYQSLSLLPEAFDCFNQALALTREHYRKCDESRICISLGNFYFLHEQPDKAKIYYEKALAAARFAEDMNLEEDSILSLAYANQALGCFDSIADDFKAVAERAFQLRHYQKSIKFLVFSGEINIEEREIETSADMFEQALYIAFFLMVERLSKYGASVDKSFIVKELREVIDRICDSIKEAVEADAAEYAKAMYDSLLSKLQNRERWSEDSSWIPETLKPAGNYLAKRLK